MNGYCRIKCQKIFQNEEVYQATLRENTRFLIFEKNIIEFYSTNEKNIYRYIESQLRGLSDEYSDVIEIGSKKILKHSNFIFFEHLSPENGRYYDYLNEILNSEIQLLLVQTSVFEKETMIKTLSDISASAMKPRLIIFITNSNTPQILPILNFAQVNSQSIIDVVAYKKEYDKNSALIERVSHSIKFNQMI
ncbi:hypothetical protein UA3_02601 [Enterococcus faecium EnGen0263]|uniref:hypothetical protein n=1 Tax=Enterococcus faecium TaxID=1352 RepID=UPI00032FBAEF|nr:hypothetical protein [Enterococcus faecium]EOH52475.1 hypothetical protein UA3_02601 [Enterococcus faecium EnGen0263]